MVVETGGQEMAMWFGRILVLAWAALATAAHAGEAPDGELLFRHRCGFCHQFHDLGRDQIGPDLTRVAEHLDGWQIARYIQAPRSIDANSRMPEVRGLRKRQVEAIVQLLTTPRVVPAAVAKE
jgi:mono/diheme cytochrome c family protein